MEEKKEKSRISNEDLEKQCNLKCKKLWQNYEELIEKLREKTHKNVWRVATDNKWTSWKKGGNSKMKQKKMLKKLEIWGLNLQHLLKKGPKEKNIVFGVELVAKKLESSFPELHEKIKRTAEKNCIWRRNFLNFGRNSFKKSKIKWLVVGLWIILIISFNWKMNGICRNRTRIV